MNVKVFVFPQLTTVK